jgi:aryl-phospho-beta-D-glucosidase BglC (GH1 family)
VSGIAPTGTSYVALGASVPTAAAGETHYLATPVLTTGATGSPALNGPLSTAGNKIYDVNGAPVTLRGINRSGTYNSAPDTLSQYDIDRIKAWGGNAVRITIGQHVWMPGCTTYDPTTRGKVDQAVKWINAAGMLAILDLQWTAPTCSSGGQNPMPDQKSVLFWRDVATTYANAPLVAFDLFNEPHGVSDEVWANGGQATTDNGTTYQAVGMQTLYDTVRSSGADNLVLINGLGWASTWPSTAPLPNTTNVVYAVHAYNCGTPETCTNGTGISWMLDRFVSPGRAHPIMVSEFGWPATGLDAQTFNRNVISFAEAQGWSWMPWTWPVNGNCDQNVSFDLVANDSCGDGKTYQPAPAGMPILTGLRANT